MRKFAVHLGYSTYIWLSVSKLPLKCSVLSLYSVVKQRLKCNTGKVCNRLIKFLLTMVHEKGTQHLQLVHSDFPNTLYLVIITDNKATLYVVFSAPLLRRLS
jgi:hypothetical protein